MASVVHSPGQGETITAREKRDVVIKAAHPLVDMTWTRYARGERGPDPHIHKEHADAFYVLDGELVFTLGSDEREVRAETGTLVLVPAGLVHTFANLNADDTIFLNIHAPSEGFAESLRARRDGRTIDPERFDSFKPPADGGPPASRAIVRSPGKGDSVSMGVSRAVFKAEGTDGDGTFSLTETTLAPGFPGPVAHRHREHVDSFYVLEGTLTVRIGDETVEVRAGSYAFVPPGTVHTFSNASDEIVRVLNLMAPGGFEQYLKEAAAAIGEGPPNPGAMAEIASHYDFEKAER
jgi:quercetin dioxygenase-like cupin family protein